MLYDKISVSKIELGKPKKLGSGTITPIFYDGSSFEFSLKNKYVRVNGITTNVYDKDTIVVKSKLYSDIVEEVSTHLKTQSPVFGDGTFRAAVNTNTTIKNGELEKLRNAKFEACISLNFVSLFEDDSKSKKTLQVYVKDLIVTKLLEEDLEVDFNKLELAE